MRFVLIVIVVSVVGIALWLWSAWSLSVLIERLPVSQLRYDNGVIELAGVRLDTLTPETMPSGLTAVLAASGRVSLVREGKSFPCGPGHSQALAIEFSPDPGDTISFRRERSYLSWPTPFEMNFMTGSAPSWKRYQYYRLTWTKRSRAHLEILWRFEQGYFRQDGWRPQTITYGSAGLLRTSITEASRP